MEGRSWEAAVYNVRTSSRRRNLQAVPAAKIRHAVPPSQNFRPTCPNGPIRAKPYQADVIPTTALASFPRSGSSYTRSLVERASGYQVSSIYCDWRLRPAFAGECDGLDSPFLVKTRRLLPALRWLQRLLTPIFCQTGRTDATSTRLSTGNISTAHFGWCATRSTWRGRCTR